MLGTCLENVRNTVPLVHNITNYVTVNDVANILLACGGSPIMSDEPEDVEDITSICGGLNINSVLWLPLGSTRDGQFHRHRLPALRLDDGLRRCKPRQ